MDPVYRYEPYRHKGVGRIVVTDVVRKRRIA